MKALFIYVDVSSAVGYSAGIGALSAVLKADGHQTKLIHVSGELGYPLDLNRINDDIREFAPGVICFSVTTNQWHFAKEVGASIRREFSTPIIVGGHHPTADPDDAISEHWVDFVCRGEGDKVLVELVRILEAGKSPEALPNLVYKNGDGIVHQPLTSWVEDLDDLPFEDREIFDFSRIVDTRSGWAEVIVTRGCPYPCAYCFNRPLLRKYAEDSRAGGRPFSKRRFTHRRRSVDSTITMLKSLADSCPNVSGITFVDDIMATEGEWFEEFTRRYKKEVGLPYACTSHPLLFTRRVAGLLRDSGCKVVKMGIEAGNPEIRRKVLKRNLSDEQLVGVFETAKEFGLKPQAFNMIGLPGESIENIMETINLNSRIKPYIVWLSTFVPYPGTELYHECENNGMIDESRWDSVDTYRGASVLKDEYLPSMRFKKIRVLFRWYLNANLGVSDEMEAIYRDGIEDLTSLPDEQWENGSVERLFLERDAEIDRQLREKDLSHYIKKKYINIYWGREYNYDIT
jgi:anaerobic magnesium-protoporphyrin IX monomethyl ester cyclase